MAASPFVEVLLDTPTGERTIKVTNPEKTYFPGLPEGRGRKIDLVDYWIAMGEGAVRAVRERPTVLKRHPGGALTEAIYQKRVPASAPPWIETVTVQFPSGRSATELCPVDTAHLVWAASQGTLDLHPWPTRRGHVENPDELRIDLDPMPGTDWDDVVEVARELHGFFDELGWVSFPKTSGSKGVHVYVRIRPEWSFTEARHCAVAVAREIERRRPDVATARWWREERGEGVFLDYNRMARDQTIASAYSVRALPRATVSAPVTWDELESCQIADFDIWSMRDRVARLGDVHAAIDDVAHDLTPLLELYERQGEGEAPFPPSFALQPGEPKRVQPSRDTDRRDTDRRDTDRRDTDRGDTDRGDTDRGDTDRGDTDRPAGEKHSRPKGTSQPRRQRGDGLGPRPEVMEWERQRQSRVDLSDADTSPGGREL